MALPSPDLLGLSAILGLGLGAYVTATVGRTMHVLMHPPRRTYASAVSRARPGDPSEIPPPAGPLEFERWTFRSRGRDLPAWDVRGARPRGPVVVMSHGWGDSRLGGLSRVGHVARLASRVVMWDMPGHGEAPGVCSLGTREVEDLLALIAHVREPNVEMILHGWSLGAGVSIAAAARGVGERTARIAGVIAESPYRHAPTPARNVLRERRLPHGWNVTAAFWLLGLDLGIGPRWKGRGGFDRANLAARLTCPLLVLHGDQDAVSPIEDGEAIARQARDGTIARIEGGGHVGLWSDPEHGPRCAASVGAFIERVSGRAT